MFTIGSPTNPKDGDECYDTAENAEDAAIMASYDDSVWAVRDEDGEILSLVFAQQVFTA